jgi:hypothetical protein
LKNSEQALHNGINLSGLLCAQWCWTLAARRLAFSGVHTHKPMFVNCDHLRKELWPSLKVSCHTLDRKTYMTAWKIGIPWWAFSDIQNILAEIESTDNSISMSSTQAQISIGMVSYAAELYVRRKQ